MEIFETIKTQTAMTSPVAIFGSLRGFGIEQYTRSTTIRAQSPSSAEKHTLLDGRPLGLTKQRHAVVHKLFMSTEQLTIIPAQSSEPKHRLDGNGWLDRLELKG